PAAVMWFFAFRGSHYLGMWIAFAVLNMYTMFVSFARARLKLMGIGWLARLAVVFVLFTAFISLVGWQLRGSTEVILDTLNRQNFRSSAAVISAVLRQPPVASLQGRRTTTGGTRRTLEKSDRRNAHLIVSGDCRDPSDRFRGSGKHFSRPRRRRSIAGHRWLDHDGSVCLRRTAGGAQRFA